MRSNHYAAAATGAAPTLIPTGLYLLTHWWFFVPLSFVLVVPSAILCVAACWRRAWVMACACIGGPVAAWLIVWADLRFLEARVRRDAVAYEIGGRTVLQKFSDLCPSQRGPAGFGLYCKVTRDRLGTTKLASEVLVVGEAGGREIVLFLLRPGSRMRVAYAPGYPNYPCPRIGDGVYLCDSLRLPP